MEYFVYGKNNYCSCTARVDPTMCRFNKINREAEKMESCSRPMAVCSVVDGRFWVHLQLVTVQLRGVGFCGGDEESIISLSNREWHWWRLWEEEAEAGEHAASLVAVLHSTRAAPVMDWRQLEGGRPESIKVSSWNRVCVCEGGHLL